MHGDFGQLDEAILHDLSYEPQSDYGLVDTVDWTKQMEIIS